MGTKRAGLSDALVAWSYAPGPQLAVITTGLTAVVGSTLWQVLWLLGVTAAALLHLFPPKAARTTAPRGPGDERGDGLDGPGRGPGPATGLTPP